MDARQLVAHAVRQRPQIDRRPNLQRAPGIANGREQIGFHLAAHRPIADVGHDPGDLVRQALATAGGGHAATDRPLSGKYIRAKASFTMTAIGFAASVSDGCKLAAVDEPRPHRLEELR